MYCCDIRWHAYVCVFGLCVGRRYLVAYNVRASVSSLSCAKSHVRISDRVPPDFKNYLSLPAQTEEPCHIFSARTSEDSAQWFLLDDETKMVVESVGVSVLGLTGLRLQNTISSGHALLTD